MDVTHGGCRTMRRKVAQGREPWPGRREWLADAATGHMYARGALTGATGFDVGCEP
jgi:hypothetical protein